MNYLWLRFASEVTIRSARSVEECVRSLQTLTAPPNSYFREYRKRPFRGEVTSSGGCLRQSLSPSTYTFMPFRKLEFAFISSSSGTEFRGQWLILKRIQIPIMIYLTLCLISEIVTLTRTILIHSPGLFIGLVAPLVAFAALYGWTWVGVVLSRKMESQLLSAVFHAMESDRSAKIVGELLSSPQ